VVVVVDWVRRLGGLGLAVGDSRFDAMLEMGCGRVQSPVSPRFSVGGGFQHFQDLDLGISLRGLCVTELRSPSENSLVSN
jgi:hypothetical protein